VEGIVPEKGERLSDETKAKMSAAHKGEKNPNYGKPRSEETKAKIRAAHARRREAAAAAAGGGGLGAGSVSESAVSVTSLADPVRLAQQVAFSDPSLVPGPATLPGVRSVPGVGMQSGMSEFAGLQVGQEYQEVFAHWPQQPPEELTATMHPEAAAQELGATVTPFEMPEAGPAFGFEMPEAGPAFGFEMPGAGSAFGEDWPGFLADPGLGLEEFAAYLAAQDAEISDHGNQMAAPLQPQLPYYQHELDVHLGTEPQQDPVSYGPGAAQWVASSSNMPFMPDTHTWEMHGPAPEFGYSHGNQPGLYQGMPAHNGYANGQPAPGPHNPFAGHATTHPPTPHHRSTTLTTPHTPTPQQPTHVPQHRSARMP
jgi:hypothetical protein